MIERKFEVLNGSKNVRKLNKKMDTSIDDYNVKKEMFAKGTPVAILDNEYKQVPYDGYPIVYWINSEINLDASGYELTTLTAFFGQTKICTNIFDKDSGKIYEAGQPLFAKRDGKKTVLTNRDPNEDVASPNPNVKHIAFVEDVIRENEEVVALRIRTL
jgi:hypothetical protein